MKLHRIVYAIFIASGYGCKWIKVMSQLEKFDIYNACGGKQQLTNMLKVTLVQ